MRDLRDNRGEATSFTTFAPGPVPTGRAAVAAGTFLGITMNPVYPTALASRPRARLLPHATPRVLTPAITHRAVLGALLALPLAAAAAGGAAGAGGAQPPVPAAAPTQAAAPAPPAATRIAQATSSPRIAASAGTPAATRVASAAATSTAATHIASAATATPALTLDVAAGSLESALNAFGRQAGVLLSFDPALVRGRDSHGLRGTYTPAEGLRQLLAGSGLEAVALRHDSFRLQRASAEPAVARLSTVRVTGTTEGTGSYTTDLTNTATKLDLTLRETPQSVSVFTRQRMQDQALDDIAEVLDQTVGLHFNNTNVVGGDSNFVYSRGFVLDNYQVNGVPRSTRFGFKNDIGDTTVFDRVEVVRGASGLLNGIGEPAGAVNLVRKMPTHDFQASVAARAGSWNFRRAEADVSGPVNDAGTLRARAVAAYQDNDTFIDRVSLDRKVFYGVVEADLTPSTILSAGVEYQDHRTRGAGGAFQGTRLVFSDGSPTHFGRSDNLAANWAFTTRKSLSLFSSLEHYWDNDWRVRLDVEHERREYDIVQAGMVNALAPRTGAGQFRAVRYAGDPRQDSAGVYATGPYTLFGRQHELVLGASYARMDGWSASSTRVDGNVADGLGFMRTGDYPYTALVDTGAGSTTNDWQSGLYAATRIKPTERLSVLLGSRLSNWKTRTDRRAIDGTWTRGTTSQEKNVFTPYAGIVFDVTDAMSVYASYTDIFQPAKDYDAAGELLSPAEGTNVEAGAKFAFFDDALNLSLAYYRTRKDNVPEYVPGPGGTVNVGPNGQYVYRGVDGTVTTGVEAEISGQITPRWQVSGGVSVSNPKDAQGQRRLRQIPRKTVKLFTSYRLDAWLPGLMVGGNLRWQDGITAAAPGNNTQGSFVLVDAMAQYEFNRHWTATLNVNNLFDKSYFTNLAGDYGWYGEPRSAFVNLRYAF